MPRSRAGSSLGGVTTGSGSSACSTTAAVSLVASAYSHQTATSPAVAVRVTELLRDVHTSILLCQEERTRDELHIENICKTHERMQTEHKISPYFKQKLKGLYTTAIDDAHTEIELLKRALQKIEAIKVLRNGETRPMPPLPHAPPNRMTLNTTVAASSVSMSSGSDSEPPRKIMRRGMLMTVLQQTAHNLPLWMGKPDERPPPLCGAIPPEPNHISSAGEYVTARVKDIEGDETWILAEVASYSTTSNKYEVDDIDEEGKERHTLNRRRIIPLPLMKADPEKNPEAFHPAGTLVMALYPQTTCFYRAWVHELPVKAEDDYLVLFEDNSYADGYSPPLSVPQRYIVVVKESKKR